MPKLSPKDMQAALAVAQKAFKEKFTPGFYHGSPSNKIKEFDPTKSVKDPMYITPKATFVTRDPEFAESFLSMNNSGKIKPGSTMYPVNVNLGQHWHPDTPEGQQLIQEFIEKYPKRAGLQKGLNRGDWTAVENSDFLTHLKDTGHDTFHVMEGGVPNVGVLKPENIRGKFAEFNPEDAADPDFMKAEGGLAHLARGGMLRRGTTYGTPQQQAVNYIAPKPLQATTTAFNKMPSPTPVSGGSTTMPGTPPMVPVQKPVVPIQNSKTAATSTVPAGGATFAQAPTQQPLPTPLPTPTPNPDQAAYQTYLSGRQGQNNMSYGDWSTWNTNYNNQDPGYQAYLKSNQGGGTDANGNAMASLAVMPMTYGDWKQYSQPSAMSSPNTGNGNSAAIYDPTGSLSQPGTPSGPSGSAGTGGIASLINSTQQLPGSLTMNVQAAPQQPQPPQPPTQINSVLGNLIGGTIPGIAAGKAGGRVQHFEFGGAVKKALQYARTVPFTHFSHSSNISRLEPSLYGSGIKGAEASRLKDAPDIKPRSYIYVSKENVRPEQGLGPHRYEGVAENMYPLHEDPAGFSAKARELAKDPYFAKMGVEIVDQPKHLNELERQIKNAGYSGYADDNVGLLFNPTDVTKVTD